jgi:hypothetical protein
VTNRRNLNETSLESDVVNAGTMTDDPNFNLHPLLVDPIDDSEIAAPNPAEALKRGRKRLAVLLRLGFQAINRPGELLAYGPIEVKPILRGLLKELDFVGQNLGLQVGPGNPLRRGTLESIVANLGQEIIFKRRANPFKQFGLVPAREMSDSLCQRGEGHTQMVAGDFAGIKRGFCAR